MTGGSLKARLLAAGAASIVLALTIAGFGLMLLFERHLEARVTLELESHLRQLVGGLARAGDGSLELAVPLAEPRFNEPLSGLYWQIVVEPDGPVLRSRSLWDAVLDLPPDRLATGEAHRHTIQGPGGASLLAIERQVVLPPDLGGETIRAAVAIDRLQICAAVLAFASDLVPSLGLLAAFLVLAAWVQVWVGLKPLDAVRRQLAAVVAGRDARFGAAFPDEVRPLAVELDRLLEAQEAAIERARARAADLAHGLKTPLTVLSAEAEELRARGETRIADEIATLADAMRRHVERELARGRAGIRARGGASQPVRGVVDRVVGVLRRTPRGQESQLVDRRRRRSLRQGGRAGPGRDPWQPRRERRQMGEGQGSYRGAVRTVRHGACSGGRRTRHSRGWDRNGSGQGRATRRGPARERTGSRHRERPRGGLRGRACLAAIAARRLARGDPASRERSGR